VIQFENVTKMYPKTEKAALNGVNLDISKGEFVFLVGLSGSGKSTFLRLVLREERPTTGVIHVAGKDLSTLAAHKVPELRRQVGTVFQDFRLLPNKTVSENVAFTLHVLGYSNKQISLDPATSVGSMKLLDRINREGTTVVMATHDAGIVDQMRKRVIELEGGHVIRDQARGVYGYTG